MKRSLLFPIAIAKRISQCAANLVESTTNNSFGKRSNQLLGLCKHLALLNHLILLQKVDQITQFVKCLLSITLDSRDHLLRLQQNALLPCNSFRASYHLLDIILILLLFLHLLDLLLLVPRLQNVWLHILCQTISQEKPKRTGCIYRQQCAASFRSLFPSLVFSALIWLALRWFELRGKDWQARIA